ncbi:cellulose biosynthesis protein BcsS [Blastochloris viridis]|uniref:Cellulose biosynthesis protein BcsS n=1 Tax=Blastochloris viridis TaxID=1079 RepID=A0A0H5BI60_BLAVI|nr:cellulose biosynthesis protein BcsS [Blastochloris viridis]ALK10000.1 hypothetical protein BVIR_2232 [Blastochloris viridis]BAS00082.1 hypothetical protein BV133_2488 [Blastochloris viridis]CUU42664.1 hypothetical protein BVIRIDIS_16780 [Blastochloris viridis]
MGRRRVIAAGMLCCAAATLPAAAADRPESAPLPQWLLFSGADASIRSTTGWIGGEYAADGLDKSGLRLRGVIGSGSYRTGHPSLSAADINVDKRFATFSVGHGWVAPTWRAAVFAGTDLDARSPDVAGAAPGDRGTRLGATLGAELWATPSPAVQVTASLGVATTRSSWAFRTGICHRIGSLCLGADAASIGDAAGSELRLGAAVAGLSLGALEMRIGGGLARKNDGDRGCYGYLSAWQRF